MYIAKQKPGFLNKLRQRLNRGNSWLTYDLANLIPGHNKVDDELLDALEDRLLMADVGVEAAAEIVDALRNGVRKGEIRDGVALHDALAAGMRGILEPASQPLEIESRHRPYVILMVGVNGAGKTTTIGKISRRLLDEGCKVMLAAADTFRAAAVEQLQAWGERNGVPVIAQGTGADPAAVAYDALEAARARKADVLIVDTAGRLHTQSNLMEELKKVRRVLARLDPTAPHEVMLVLDATTGQNALAQARQFRDAVGVTGLTVTKLDGTAKGGILFALTRQLGIPIRFIGVGEQAEDLDVFDASNFVDGLLFDRDPARSRSA